MRFKVLDVRQRKPLQSSPTVCPPSISTDAWSKHFPPEWSFVSTNLSTQIFFKLNLIANITEVFI